MGPEYVTGTSFETMLPLDFCTVLKILIYCSLIKRLSNDRKRYSSYLQVSMRRVVSIKVYLKFMTALKTAI